jgi:ParB/RepB/Spo0J family partition protein
MKIVEIDISKLQVSKLNVRKELTNDDETDLYDLAKNIEINGLINPLTVRSLGNDNYEVIAGQRRLLASKMIQLKVLPCNVLNITEQKAIEISLIENVQRNQLTSLDKVKAYSQLYEIYNHDINKVLSSINISKATLLKYLKINTLPEEVIKLLDGQKDNKITVETAIELTKLPKSINPIEVVQHIKKLPSTQAIEITKECIKKGNIKDIERIKDNIIIDHNNIKLIPSVPYVIDLKNKNKVVIIPPNLYVEVIKMITG